MNFRAQAPRLDQIDARLALLDDKQPASYAVRSRHHANLRSLGLAASALPSSVTRTSDRLLGDKDSTDDGPYDTVT
jgi:hypothetical protein